ncbi:ABC-three component system protein [Actinomycetes bacterium NPDC127524]
MTNPHSADDSFLGYYYQGMYALVKLLEADDYDKVSIETEDDVYLEGTEKKLFQLKHSIKAVGKLNEKNDGLWKTLRIWANIVKKNAVDEKTYFIFVTPLRLEDSCSLKTLSTPNSDRNEVIDSLLLEAKRVAKARDEAHLKGDELPYKTRWPGCKAFIDLTPEQKVELVNKITIHPNNFNIKDINIEIEKRVKNTIPLSFRKVLVERLIEWWDRRVVLGILKIEEREISKNELTQQIYNLFSSFHEESLPDDYSYRDDEVDIEEEIGVNMELQIDLVNGGDYRKRRAAIARWQARNQREKWIDDDILQSNDLNRLDKQLIKEWGDIFYPMKHDLRDKCDDDLCREGCDLLDWSHKKAHTEIVPIRANWKQPFLIQGSYQQLAEELKVGWHPKFEKKIKKAENEEI